MSFALPELEVHVERSLDAVRVVARAVLGEGVFQRTVFDRGTGQGGAPEQAALVAVEAHFSGAREGAWLRITQRGVVHELSREMIARSPALAAVSKLIADEVDAISRERPMVATRALLASLCCSLLVYVQRMDNVVPLRGHRPPRDARIARALELLEADISRRWTVEALARAVGLSRPAFARQFLQSLGVSPMRYLTQRRLQSAAALLLGSDATLADVASRVGYRSEFAFSRAFRKHFHVPPGVYRRRPPTASIVALRAAA